MLNVNGRSAFGLVMESFQTSRGHYTGASPSPLKGLYVPLRAVFSAIAGGAYAKAIAKPAQCQLEVDGRLGFQTKWLAIGVGTLLMRALDLKSSIVCVQILQGPHRWFMCSPFRMAVTVPKMYGIRLKTRRYDGCLWTNMVRSDTTQHYMVDGDLLQCDGDIHIRVSRPIQLVVPRT